VVSVKYPNSGQFSIGWHKFYFHIYACTISFAQVKITLFRNIKAFIHIGYNINLELRSVITLTRLTCIHFGRMIVCGWVHCNNTLWHEIDRIDVIDLINRIDWTYKINGLPPLSMVCLFLALPLLCPSFSYLTLGTSCLCPTLHLIDEENE